MLFYYVEDVLHATITQFQSIGIEDFVQFMISREMLPD